MSSTAHTGWCKKNVAETKWVITLATSSTTNPPASWWSYCWYSERQLFYTCVETICAPCDVVIAWAKFANSESPTNILNFLESVYPTEDSRPDYICIDKACLVLQTAIVNGSWDRIWKSSTHFIVDAYHHINHHTTDYLCRKWCNPAPLNGSALNLVVVDTDREENQYYKQAFNTQVLYLLCKVLKLLIITLI